MSIIGEAFVAVSPESEGFAEKLKSQLTGGGGLGGFGSLIGVAAVAATVAALADIGEKFADVRHQIQQETGATGAQLTGLFDAVKTELATVPASFGDATTAVDELFKRGVPLGAQLDKLAEQELFLAKITKTDLGSNVEATTALFAKFNVPLKDQSAELDVLFKASQQSGKGLGDLISNLQTGGTSLQEFGFSLDQSASLIAGLEKAGINVGPVLSSLRRSFSQIAKEGQDPKKVLSDLITELTDGKNPTQAMADALKLFGARGGAELANAIKSGKFSVDGLLKSITDGKGGIIATGEATESLGDKVKLFENQALVNIEPIGTAILNAFETGAEAAAPVLEHLGESIVHFVAAVLPAIAPVGLAIGATFELALPVISTLADGIDELTKGLDDVPAPVLAVAGALGTLALVSNSAGTGFLLSAGSIKAFVTSIVSGSAAVVTADSAVAGSTALIAAADADYASAQAARAAATAAVLANSSALLAAQQAEVAASLAQTEASTALADLQFQLAESSSVESGALLALAAAKERVTLADAQLFAAQTEVSGLFDADAVSTEAASVAALDYVATLTAVSGGEQLAAVAAAKLVVARGAEADAAAGAATAQAAFATALLAVQTAEAGDVVAAEALITASSELAAANLALTAAEDAVTAASTEAGGAMAFLGTAMDIALGPVGLIVGGLLALGVATHLLGGGLKDDTTNTTQLAGVFDDASGSAATLGGRVDALTDSLKQFLQQQLTTGKTTQEGIVAQHAFGLSYDDTTGALQSSTEAFFKWYDGLRAAGPITKDTHKAIEEFSNVVLDSRTQLEASAKAAINQAVANKQITRSEADLVLQQTSVTRSTGDVTKGQRDYLTALKELAPTIDLNAAKQNTAAAANAQASQSYSALVDALASGQITTADAGTALAAFGFDADGAKAKVADLQSQIKSFASAVASALPGTADAAKQFAGDVNKASGQLATDTATHTSLLQQLSQAGGKASTSLKDEILANNKAIKADNAALVADTDPAKFVQNLQVEAFNAGVFFINIKKLVAEGFGPLAGQLLQLGPVAGGALAAGLASDKTKAKQASGAAAFIDNNNAAIEQYAAQHEAELTGVGTAAAASVTGGLTSGISGSKAAVGVSIQEAVGGAVAATHKNVTDYQQAGAALGVALGQGLIGGMALEEIAINGQASRMADGVKHILGSGLEVKSPSAFTFRLGSFLGEGLALGLVASTPRAVAAAQAFTDGIRTPLKGITTGLASQLTGQFTASVPAIVAAQRQLVASTQKSLDVSKIAAGFHVPVAAPVDVARIAAAFRVPSAPTTKPTSGVPTGAALDKILHAISQLPSATPAPIVTPPPPVVPTTPLVPIGPQPGDAAALTGAIRSLDTDMGSLGLAVLELAALIKDGRTTTLLSPAPVPTVKREANVKIDVHKVDVNPRALAQELGWVLG